MNDSEYLQGLFWVITTEVDKDKASKLADILLSKKLIACVSFNEIESRFWWKDDIQKTKEVQLIMKCRKEDLKEVCCITFENHTYDIPEISYLPVTTNKHYYEWAANL